jgi:hypothetical protein
LGWKGGTGWNENVKSIPPPYFIGNFANLTHQERGPGGIAKMRQLKVSPAFGGKSMQVWVFACNREQIGGGMPQKSFHPLIILRISGLRMAIAGESQPMTTPSERSAAHQSARLLESQRGIANKHGGGTGLSHRRHPVPPFHPAAHALLDN